MSIVLVRGLSKEFTLNGHTISVLRKIDLEISPAESVSLVGPSGSGKSTLMSLLAGLDRPTSGEIALEGQSLAELSEDELADLRSKKIGFVFQSFQLISSLTALENVMVPAELKGMRGARKRSGDLLQQVGLGQRLEHYPHQLSGGEQQRVAIARAYINQPKILFADEPTGSLDYENAQAVRDLLFSLKSDFGSALVLATHSQELARETDRTVFLREGSLNELGSEWPVKGADVSLEDRSRGAD